MLWDIGTWEPEQDDVDEALRKGDFKFTLYGQKLKGSWVLVRTRGYGSSAGLSIVKTSRNRRINNLAKGSIAEVRVIFLP